MFQSIFMTWVISSFTVGRERLYKEGSKSRSDLKMIHLTM